MTGGGELVWWTIHWPRPLAWQQTCELVCRLSPTPAWPPGRADQRHGAADRLPDWGNGRPDRAAGGDRRLVPEPGLPHRLRLECRVIGSSIAEFHNLDGEMVRSIEQENQKRRHVGKVLVGYRKGLLQRARQRNPYRRHWPKASRLGQPGLPLVYHRLVDVESFGRTFGCIWIDQPAHSAPTGHPGDSQYAAQDLVQPLLSRYDEV